MNPTYGGASTSADVTNHFNSRNDVYSGDVGNSSYLAVAWRGQNGTSMTDRDVTFDASYNWQTNPSTATIANPKKGRLIER